MQCELLVLRVFWATAIFLNLAILTRFFNKCIHILFINLFLDNAIWSRWIPFYIRWRKHFFFWRVYKINAKRNRNYSNQVELYHPEFFVTTLQVTQLFIWYIGCFNRILIFLMQLFEESIINQDIVLKTKNPEKKLLFEVWSTKFFSRVNNVK